MTTIEDVETIGIYHDEIRIISKHRDPMNLTRNGRQISIEDIVRVDDLYGKGIAIHLQDGVHCNVADRKIKCGLFIGHR